MQQIWKLWTDAAKDDISRTVVAIFILVTLILIAVYVVGWFRNLAVGKEEPVIMFEDLEALRNQGKISLEEYQRLKKTVNQKLAEELTQSGTLKREIRKNSESKDPKAGPVNPFEPPENPDSSEPDFRPVDQ